MIIVKVKGGLGNQMFQYALGRRLAIEHNTQLKLDLSWFDSQQLRTYQLDKLNIKAEIASKDEVEMLLQNPPKNIFSKFKNRAAHYLPFIAPKIIRQKKVGFDARALKVKGDVYLDGYWQSEKYFEPIVSILREELKPKIRVYIENEPLLDRILQPYSVSIHIRRTDYVDHPKVSSVHGALSLEYFYSAVAHISENVKNAEFFVFSDDLPWAIENIKINFPKCFVNYTSPQKDVDELFLMSYCQHHIISNSSFSWWGAWINENSSKTVIAPKTWFRKKMNMQDLLPGRWTKI